jgi:polyisoprenoid-binding protein YceI
MRKTSTLLVIAALLLGSRASAESAANPPALSEWAIDPTHAHVGFTIPHMVVSEVEGQIKQFKGKVLLDEKDLKNSQVEFTAEIASIDTENADRDKHLKGPEFFDAEKFPQLTFKSSRITKAGKGYKLEGELTVHGVKKPVVLDATVSDSVTSPWGKQVRAAKITGKLKRSDFGLTWNKTLDKGGMLVGDTVDLNIKLELNK